MTQQIANNNRRLMRNTLMLYLRMFVIMLVSLYTSRVLLEAIGVTDYGIYNVVAGVVVLFVFINNAMVVATQRFLNYELGRHDLHRMRRIFSMSLNVHVFIALVVAVLSETVGLYIFYHYLNIPSDRITAAQIVYQLSVAATVVNIVRTPYHAVIIAYERMSVFAYISVFEEGAKLAVAFALLSVSSDRLVLYASLLLGVTVIVSVFYFAYSRMSFPVCRYEHFRDKDLFSRLISFSGWSLFGTISWTSAFEAVSIVQNYYGGVIVNAAMGVATQVTAAVYGLSCNYQMAFNPQITKYYAAEEFTVLRGLTNMATKTSFFLVWIFVLPLTLSCREWLGLWLTDVPDYSVQFCQWIMLCSALDAMSAPLGMNVFATGRIRLYQICVSVVIFMNLPLSIAVLHFGLPPQSVLVVRFGLSVVLLLGRGLYLLHLGLIQLGSYLSRAIVPVVAVALLTTMAAALATALIDNFILRTVIIFATTSALTLLAGFSSRERAALKATLVGS